MAKINLDTLVEIASEVEKGDPIDWGKLKVGQVEAFKMVGTSIIEMFDKETYTDEDKYVILATITKLTVENMLLHTKLLATK
jgi:hypothetical protein